MFLIQSEKSRRAETANTSQRGKEIKGPCWVIVGQAVVGVGAVGVGGGQKQAG